MKPPEKRSVEPRPTPRGAFLWAAIAILVVRRLVPFGDLVLYPFTLLATWVHELGHGLTALAVGGSFERLEIFANASGLAYTTVPEGWPHGLVSLGGLLGPPVAGASMLLLARGPRRAHVVLWILAGALGVSLLVWVRSLAGWLAMPPVMALIGAVALFGSARERMFTAHGIAALFALDTVSRLDYLFRATAWVDGRERASDIANVAEAFGGAYPLWGALVAVFAVGLVSAAVYVTLRWGGASPPPKVRRVPEVVPSR